jgi:hypothetical protein
MRGRTRPVRIAYAAVEGGRGFDKEALREVDARHRTLLATSRPWLARRLISLSFRRAIFKSTTAGASGG